MIGGQDLLRRKYYRLLECFREVSHHVDDLQVEQLHHSIWGAQLTNERKRYEPTKTALQRVVWEAQAVDPLIAGLLVGDPRNLHNASESGWSCYCR